MVVQRRINIKNRDGGVAVSLSGEWLTPARVATGVKSHFIFTLAAFLRIPAKCVLRLDFLL